MSESLYTESDLREGFFAAESDCESNTQRRYETVMCLGNGYLGVRSAFCEAYPLQSRLTLIAGLYDRQPQEEEELIPLPDVTELTLTANGTEIGPLHADARDYSRTLKLKNGLLTYSYRYAPNGGNALSVVQRRFVSMDHRHLVAFETVVKAESPIELSVAASINARQTVNGTQHSFTEECTVLKDHLLWFGGRAVAAQTAYRIGMRIKLFLNGKEISDLQRYASSRRLLSSRAKIGLSEGDELRVVRYALFYTENDAEWGAWDKKTVGAPVAQEMDNVSQRSFSELLAASEQQWANIWKHCDISVQAEDPDENRKIRLAMYHMIIMCPTHDDRVSIAAKGLTGMGYAGHVFWDCEIFNLPFFAYTNPNAARNLCMYRYRTLNGAREKAKAYGFAGAMYPWESASEAGDEQCPLYKGYSPDNTPRHIACGEIEHHVVCAVAYGIFQYTQLTGDRDFADRYGNEILFETADFWQSRLNNIPEKDRYEIRQVIGPDEYKEYVDNDVYTNYMAAWNLKTALATAEALQKNNPAKFEALERSLGLTKLMREIRKKLPKLYLPKPNENGLIPQNDTYLSLQKIDLKKYKESGINRLIQKDYSMQQIGQLMVSKQADLIQLVALMPRLFDAETVKTNFDFYEERCLHDSSLSLSAYAAVATELGDADKGHRFFRGALDTDFGAAATLCNEGIHAANCGGIWQTVVFGFAGIRADGDVLHIRPKLPSAWKTISVCLFWRGCELKITVSRESVTIELPSGKELQTNICGQTYTIRESITVACPANQP